MNQMGGGGNGSSRIEYYRLIDSDITNGVLSTLILYSSCFLNCVHGETIYSLHNHSIANNYLASSSDRYKILAIAFIDIKSVFDNEDISVTFTGTLQERADYIATMMDEDKININDYLEPITEEEFYNIKPE